MPCSAQVERLCAQNVRSGACHTLRGNSGPAALGGAFADDVAQHELAKLRTIEPGIESERELRERCLWGHVSASDNAGGIPGDASRKRSEGT